MQDVTRFSPFTHPPEDSPEYLEWLAWRIDDRQFVGVHIHPKTIPLLTKALRVHATVFAKKEVEDAWTVRAIGVAGAQEILAYATNSIVARAAYEAVLTERPRQLVTLQQRHRIVEASDRRQP